MHLPTSPRRRRRSARRVRAPRETPWTRRSDHRVDGSRAPGAALTAARTTAGQRRAAAIKSNRLSYSAASDAEALEMRAHARMDVMLESNYSEADVYADADDDEYNEDGDEAATKKKRKRAAPKPKASSAAESRAKRHRPKSVAQMLLDDFGGGDTNGADYISATAPPSRRPPHNVCVVTGKLARYRDPETALPFSDVEAGEMLRENPPAWLKLGRSSGSPYYEAVLQIRAARAKHAAERPESSAADLDEASDLWAGSRPPSRCS
ncbi:hypothetical protein M885DRAFT_614968 [Pelagophyceae sp. CCMP2097]|nr:hypothetical protein M885DRAFT_614968 [Pelagophyceae sp. CCMP2097]